MATLLKPVMPPSAVALRLQAMLRFRRTAVELEPALPDTVRTILAMLTPCPAWPHGFFGGRGLAASMRRLPGRPASASIALAPLFMLGGCTTLSPGPSGAWLLAALVLALAVSAALAYALGSVRARQHGQAELRAAREAQRHAEGLHGGYSWQTDEHHQLKAWQAPGQPVATACTLFDPSAADADLLARLQSGQAFAGVRVLGRAAVDGSLCWELRGLPRVDDEGRFAAKRPLDARLRRTMRPEDAWL